jgi:serine/threonine protein phosphatase 1
MTYVTANIHGCYTKFMELLRLIKFKDKDVLYVLGDIVDYGDEPMELICDISMRYNVYAVAGEHDLTAARMLTGFEKMLKKGKSPDKAYIAEMNAWVSDGGKATLDGYRALDAEMKEGVIDYLSDMSLYENIKVNGREYILVHAGLGSLESGNADPKLAEMFSAPLDFNKVYFKGKTVIAGHVPTDKIPGAAPGKIYRTEGCIAVDCGAARGGRIGCLRLDDGAEFYV